MLGKEAHEHSCPRMHSCHQHPTLLDFFPQATAVSVTFLCVLVVGCSLGQALQLLIGVTVHMGCWRCWHVRADPLPKSMWLRCFLPIQHFFGGGQGFEGSHGLKAVTHLLDDLLGSLVLMWQNQVGRFFAPACWDLCWVVVDGKSLKGWCGASDAQCKKSVINREFWASRTSSVWGHLLPCFSHLFSVRFSYYQYFWCANWPFWQF